MVRRGGSVHAHVWSCSRCTISGSHCFPCVIAQTQEQHPHIGQEVRAHAEQSARPFVTDMSREHLRKLKGHKVTRGARAWQYARNVSVLAHVPQASGATDIDASCYQFGLVLGSMQRHIVSPTLGKVLIHKELSWVRGNWHPPSATRLVYAASMPMLAQRWSSTYTWYVVG